MRPLRSPALPAGLLTLFLAAAPAGAQAPPLFADLGVCTTTAGEAVRDCHVGYRTAGRLNSSRDNVVLIPTWYGGSSARLGRLIGPDAMVDTTRFFVVLVDALGNGVSTSPSNSPSQAGAAFPRLTIGDMVDAQRRLLREHLGIERLHAVVGYSMGAMQALEWAVRHPDDVGAAVALLGTPRMTTYDAYTFRTLRWMTRVSDSGLLPPDSALVPLVDFWHVIAGTPSRENQVPLASIDTTVLREAEAWKAFDLHDNRLQIDAILAHDVAAASGGDLETAAARVRARLLLVVSPDDRILQPGPSIGFAELTGADLLEVPSACGHFAMYCEPAVAERVRAFLGGGMAQS